MAFSKAFAAARKAGKKEFSYNGKKFNTKLKEDSKSLPKSGKAPIPSERPSNKEATKATPKRTTTATQSKTAKPVQGPNKPSVKSARTPRGDAQVQEHRASERKRYSDSLVGAKAKARKKN